MEEGKMNKSTEKAHNQMPGYQGNIYQMKLLMLYLQRGLKKYREFELGTEIEEAYKFDDLVFKYKKVVDGTEKNHFILLQSKHKTTVNAKITYEDIFTDTNGDFGLVKYFNAFVQTKSEKLFEDGVIEHAIIFTNINFDMFWNIPEKDADWAKLKNIKNITEEIKVDKDSSLALCKIEGGKFYRFKSDLVLPVLKPMLSEYHMIARKLIKALTSTKNLLTTNDQVLKNYDYLLAREVIDTNKKTLRTDFVEEIGNDTERGKLRSALNDVAVEENVNLNEVITNKMSIVKNFGKVDNQQIWPKDIVDADIKEFFGKHVFATGQPDEPKLGKIIINELGEQYAAYDSDLIYGHFSIEIQSWMTGKNFGIDRSKDISKSRFISFQHAKEFFIRTMEKFDKMTLKGPTIEYEKYIEKYDIGFADSKLEEIMKNFMESSDKKLFNVISEQIVISSIKVYQELIKTKNQHEFIYTRMSSLNETSINLVMEAFESLSSIHWLVIESDLDTTIENESMEKIDEICNGVIDTIQSNNEKKIILISYNDDILKSNLQSVFSSDNEFEVFHDIENTLANFTNESQSNLLKTEIIFQGCKIALGDLIINDDLKKIFDGDMILKILKNEDIEIGKRVEGLKDEKKCYIDRTLTCRVKNKENIYLISRIYEEDLCSEDLNFEIVENYDCSTEDELETFEDVVGENGSSNVYLLGKVCGKFIILKQFNEELLEKLDFQNTMQCENSCELNLISAVAGMGKSTLFTHLSEIVKERNPRSWVIKINLNDMSSKLNALKATNQSIELKQVIDFLNFGAKLETKLEKQMFEHYLLKKNIILFFDAFDEICPNYKNIVLETIEELRRKTKIKKIWLSTRPYDSILKDVKDSFTDNTLKHYYIQPFTKTDQKDYLKKSWAQSIEINEQSFDIFTEELFELLSENINDRRFEFLGVALHMMMIGFTFKDIFEDFQKSELNINERRQKLTKMLQLSELYEKFVGDKFKIYWLNKNDGNFDRVASINSAQDKYEIFLKRVKILALDSLFDENELKIFLTKEEQLNLMEYKICMEDKGDELGIVNRIVDNKPHFIHRTFSEFFTAVFLLDTLKKDDEKSLNIIKHFLNEMMVAQDYSVVCQFIESKMNNDNSKTYKNCGDLIKKLKGDKLYYVLENKWQNIAMWLIENGISLNEKNCFRGNVLHLAFSLQNSKLTSLLVTENHKSKKLMKLLEAKNVKGNSPLMVAFENGRIENVKCILETYIELKITDNVFTYKNMYEENVIHVAVGNNCDCETFVYMLNFLKKDPTKLKSCLLKKNKEHMTSIAVAVQYGQLNKVKAILDTNAELEILDSLIFDEDEYGQSVFHHAVGEKCDYKTFVCVLNFLKGDPVRLKSCLFKKDNNKWTPIDVAVKYGQLNKLKAMLDMITELEIVDNLLFDEDVFGQNVLHHILGDKCDYETLVYVMNFLKGDPVKLKSCLFKKDYNKWTPIDVAVKYGQSDKVKVMLDTITELEIQDDLIFDEDVFGKSLLHHAVGSECSYETLICMLNFLKNDPVKLESCLFKKDNNKSTPIDEAVKYSKLNKLKAMLDMIVELEILDNVIFDKDVFGKSLLHHAVDNACDCETFVFVLNFLKSDPVKLKYCLFKKDDNKNTPIAVAVKYGKLSKVKAMIDTIVELEIQDVFGKSLFHHAVGDECDYDTLVCVLNFLKSDPDELKSYLLKRDSNKWTPIDEAVKYGKLSKLKAMLDTIVELGILDDFLSNKDKESKNVFHHAADKDCDDDVLVHMLNLMKSEPAKMKALLLEKDEYLRSPLDVAVKYGRLTKLKIMLDKITELGILDDVLWNEDVEGRNIFHHAADADCDDNVPIHLFNLMKSEQAKIKVMLLVKDHSLRTPLDVVLKYRQFTKMKTLLDKITELGILDDVLLNVVDEQGTYIFQHATGRHCKDDVLIILLNLMKGRLKK